MGSSQRFTCNRCGFEADISGGGRDAGMAVRTRTMTCTGRQNLVDVI